MSAYLYRGYTVKNLGYHQPDHHVVWEATDAQGAGCFHGKTRHEVFSLIDEYEWEREWNRRHPARNCDRFRTGEEAWLAFERERPDWCDDHSSKDPDCDDCEMADCGRCMAEWLLAIAEGGAE